MARNCEKQYGKLNRMLLNKQVEDRNKKFPKRPHLEALHTVDEIKRWLPAIKQDIDFNLKQSQVICYSETKIKELHLNVVKHEQEYKRFVRKIKELDSTIAGVPWTDRPYQPKRSTADVIALRSNDCVTEDGTQFIPIATPILRRTTTECANLNSSGAPFGASVPAVIQDSPLEFDQEALASIARAKCDRLQQLPPETPVRTLFNDEEAVNATESKLRQVFGLWIKMPELDTLNSREITDNSSSVGDVISVPQSRNGLNLGYSDSSDDDNVLN